MNATEKITLLEFWNAHDCHSIFLVGTACPAGAEYTHDVEAEGEDYCDLCDTIETGLFFSEPWELLGTVNESGSWEWDGSGSPCDVRGNSYTRIVVHATSKPATPITLLSLACGLRDGSITCQALDTDLEVDALADPSGPDCYPATTIEFLRNEEVVASVGCWKLGCYHHGPNRRDNGQYIGAGWVWQQDEGDGQTSGRPCSYVTRQTPETVTWQTSEGGTGPGLMFELPVDQDGDALDCEDAIQVIQDAIDAAYHEIEVTPAGDEMVLEALRSTRSRQSVQHEIGEETVEVHIFAANDAGRPAYTHEGSSEFWTDAHDCIASARAYQVQQLREAADEIESYDYREIDERIAARMLEDVTGA